MYKTDEKNYDCAVEALSNILGKKWVGQIIWNLRNDTKRFGELQRDLDGCSKKMLTQQLEILIKNKIVLNDKKEINNIVESTYYLSESGKTLLEVIEGMMRWSTLNLECKKDN